jgi:hypothetical protein
MTSPALTFNRADSSFRSKGRTITTEVRWTVAGVPLAIVVSKKGVDIEGGAPAFDTQREEQAWRVQVEMAIVALRFIKQDTVVPPDTQLYALSMAVREDA